MRGITKKLLLLIFLISISAEKTYALNPYATSSAVVSATVVGTTFNPPILISPDNNGVTNNSRVSLVWQRPDPLPSTPLHHYDVYFDGQLFASSVSDSITTQTYYFYTITRNNNTFSLNPTTDLAQGYHTWNVTAYDTTGISASSETRTFYLDSYSPNIKLEKVDRQTLNWDTANPGSIPDVNQRNLIITTANPLLSGTVEAFANMQITLICPQNIQNCQNQTYQGNYPTGIWQHRFNSLLKNVTYTVNIIATDAGGNTNTFPVFYLLYQTTTSITPTTPATITKKPTLTPTPYTSITVTPSVTYPSPTTEISPTPYTPPILPIPTPPLEATLQKTSTNFFAQYWYLILLALGLPLHLIITLYGTQTRLALSLKFLFILFFPFLGKKEYQTTPFSTLEMFDPEKLDNTWQTKISDIRGFYHLTSPLLSNIFVKITCTGRHWKNIIIESTTLPSTCLIPLLDDTKTRQNRLRRFSMSFRSLPLALACLTSSILLILLPNYFFLTYLYLSLHLVFTEYLYPRLEK